ncbi:MAG: ATP-binding protein [Firmicutes bacterium]|nr:ATP-binding protein [Bacillota bacterium]
MADLQKTHIPEETAELFRRLSLEAHKDKELYTCPVCRDNGWFITEQGATPCKCKNASRSINRRRAAGLKPAMDDMVLADFDLRYYSVERQIKPGCSYRQTAEKALRAARIFVTACLKGECERGLYYEGNLGSGKTFLAAAITGELLNKGLAARFIVVPEFLEQLRHSYRSLDDGDYDEKELMNGVMSAPVLVLDDLGAHNSSSWTIGKIYTLLNNRLNNKLPCIITSNLKPAALAEELGPRAASRIKEMCDRYILLTDEDIRTSRERAGYGWQN